MATTTPNFGWSVPTSTDLVKDGATAIETLGDSVDASMADLLGGTSGQMLVKNSNTDMDFIWQTPNVGDITEVQAGTGISVASGTGPIPVVTNTVATAYDAKGDLIGGTGADTFSRLAVGANETRLVADSAAATGLKYVADTTNYAIAAKGNLLAGTAADTVAALTVGANGTVLTADSAQTTGLKWATPSTSLTWTLLNAGGTALSGSATTTISGISNKSDIFIVITGATSATGASEFFLRINGDTSGNYNFWYMNNQALSTYDDNIIYQGGGLTSTYALLAKPSGASDTINGTAYIRNCNSTSYKLLQTNFGGNFNAGSGYENRWGQGLYVGTSVVSSVSVTSESYNFDGGTIYVYGA